MKQAKYIDIKGEKIQMIPPDEFVTNAELDERLQNVGGTTDYTTLTNKPQIGGVELTGNKTLDDLGIQPKIADVKETEVEIPKPVVAPKVVVKEEVKAPKVVADEVKVGEKPVATKEELNQLKENLVNQPVDEEGNPINGTSGQILSTNGDGTTQWINQQTGGGSGSSENSIKRIAKYVYNENREIRPTNLDLQTGIFTLENHGITNGAMCVVVPDDIATYMPIEFHIKEQYSTSIITIKVLDKDNFMITFRGEDLVYTSEKNTTIDITKWHIELITNNQITLTGLHCKNIKIIASGYVYYNNAYQCALLLYENDKAIKSIFDIYMYNIGIKNINMIPCNTRTVVEVNNNGIGVNTNNIIYNKTEGDYDYIKKYPSLFMNREMQKNAVSYLPLSDYKEITSIKLQINNSNNGKSTAFINGFTVEVYDYGE